MIHRADSTSTRGDKTGIVIASVCFVHCIAGPVLLSFAGFASLIGVSEKLVKMGRPTPFRSGADYAAKR